MAFINKYPYTDFHELNADFLLKEISEVDAAKVNSVEYENGVDDEYIREIGTLTVSDGHRNNEEITETKIYESTYAHDQAATEGSAHTVSGGALYTEQAARIAADEALQANIDAEAEARQEADEALQANIDAEAEARAAADTTLQNNIDAEADARQEADEAITVIINEYGANQLLLTDDTENESATFTNYEAGAGADVQLAETVATNTANITANAGAINTLQGNITTAESEIDTLQESMTTAESEIDTLQESMTTAESEIDTLQESMTTAESEIDTLQTTIANHETRIEALEEGGGGETDITSEFTLGSRFADYADFFKVTIDENKIVKFRFYGTWGGASDLEFLNLAVAPSTYFNMNYNSTYGSVAGTLTTVSGQNSSTLGVAYVIDSKLQVRTASDTSFASGSSCAISLEWYAPNA